MRAGALAAPFFCVIAASCGSLDVARYAVPGGKPAARMHIEYEDTVGAVAKVFVVTRPLENNCRMAISDIAILATLGGSKNPINSYEPAWSRDVRLTAGEPITLSVSSGTISTTTRTSCGFRARFEPEADVDYEMVYRATPAQCFLKVSKQIRMSDGTTLRVPVPIVDPYPQCK